MTSHISADDDVSSARILLLDPINLKRRRTGVTVPPIQRRLQKPHPSLRSASSSPCEAAASPTHCPAHPNHHQMQQQGQGGGPQSPTFAPRPVSLPQLPERPVSGGWPGDPRIGSSSHGHNQNHHHNQSSNRVYAHAHGTHGRPHKRTRSLGSSLVLNTEISTRPVRGTRRSTVASRDGKLIKAGMGPGVSAVVLGDGEDGGSWGRRWGRIRGLLRRE